MPSGEDRRARRGPEFAELAKSDNAGHEKLCVARIEKPAMEPVACRVGDVTTTWRGACC